MQKNSHVLVFHKPQGFLTQATVSYYNLLKRHFNVINGVTEQQCFTLLRTAFFSRCAVVRREQSRTVHATVHGTACHYLMQGTLTFKEGFRLKVSVPCLILLAQPRLTSLKLHPILLTKFQHRIWNFLEFAMSIFYKEISAKILAKQNLGYFKTEIFFISSGPRLLPEPFP